MPVNELQQSLAEIFLALGGFAGKAWFGVGMSLCGALALLAVLPLVDARAAGPSGSPGWLRRLRSDATFLALAALAVLVIRAPGVTLLQVNPDESCLILGARTLVQDARYWISVEGQSLGPVATFSVALPALFGAPIDYTTIKLVGLATCIAVVAMLFFGMRDLYSARFARIFVLPLIVLLATTTFWDYVAYNGEHPTMLLLALAFVLHAPMLRDPATSRPWRAFALGFTLALVPFAKSQPGPLAFAWGVAACAFALRRGPRRVWPLVAGAGAPVLLLVAYLAASGAAYDFWQSYILNNLLYAAVGWNATQQDTSLWANFLQSPAYFFGPRDSRGIFLLVLAASAVALVGAVSSREARRRLFTEEVALGLVLCAAAVLCILMPKNNWTHYLVLLFVPASMLTAALVVRSFELLGGSGESGSRPVFSRGFLIGAVIALFGGVVTAGYNMLEGNVALHTVEENLREGREPDAVAAAILRHATPEDPVAIWGVRFQEVCQSGVWLGTREAQNERALYPSRQSDYYLRRWGADVIARRPPVVIDTCAGEWFEHFRLANFPEIEAVVLADYRLVEEVDGFRIYRREVSVVQGSDG